MKMESGDFSVTSAVPVWLGDHAVECHVLLEPGPASFIWESQEENGEDEDDPEEVLTKLGNFDRKNVNVVTAFDEPMDISFSLDDLKAKGIDLSQIIEIDFSRTNDSWMDVTSTSICFDDDVEKDPHECDVCGKSFKLLAKLKRHVEKMHPRKRGVLNKSLFSKKLQKSPNLLKLQNVEQKFDPKILKTVAENGSQCQFCRKTFLTQDLRDKHLTTFHKVQSAKLSTAATCHVCRTACSSKAHLALHMLQEHSSSSSSNKFKPGTMKLLLPQFSLFSSETQPIQTLTPYKCCLCEAILYSRLHLEAHTRIHTQEKPLGKKEGFSCDDTACQALPGFKSNDQLLVHVEAFHAFGCCQDSCSEHFASVEQLAAHKLLTHGHVQSSKDENLQIATAARQTTTTTPTAASKPLGHDMLTFIECFFNKNKTSAGVSCAYCRLNNDTYKTLDELSLHFLESHPFKCPEGCEKVWKFRSSIRKHFRSYHVGLATAFHCDHCMDIFSTQSQLGRHLSSQHNLTSAQISSHSKRMSTIKVEPKTTNDVVVKTENVPNLSDSEKVFRCPRCDKFYHHPDSIRKHCRKVHKILVLNCRHCFIVFLTTEEKTKHINDVHGTTSSSSSPSSSPEKSTENQRFLVTDVRTVKSVDEYDQISSEKSSFYQCPKCVRTYTIAKSLRKHCRFAHGQLSICFCTLCSVVFTSTTDKEDHISKVHSGSSETSSRDTIEIASPDNVETNHPSSPDEFNGFTTPTKEIEQGKDVVTIRRRLALSP